MNENQLTRQHSRSNGMAEKQNGVSSSPKEEEEEEEEEERGVDRDSGPR